MRPHSEPRMSDIVRYPERRPRGGRFGASLLAIFVSALIAAVAAGLFQFREEAFGWIAARFAPSGKPAAPSADPLRASFSLCAGAVRVNCVADGDTFWFEGEKIRIADIDAPEISPPRCAREAELGEAAKRRLLALLNEGHFSLVKGWRDEDRYGRKLRTVKRGGHSLGAMLVAEGLARRWDGARHPWC